MLAAMTLISPPLRRAQQLFDAGVSANDIIDELQDEFGLDPATAIAAVASMLLVAVQVTTTVDEPMVRPYLAAASPPSGVQ